MNQEQGSADGTDKAPRPAEDTHGELPPAVPILAGFPGSPPTEVGSFRIMAGAELPHGPSSVAGGPDQTILALCLQLKRVDEKAFHLAPRIPSSLLIEALQSYLELDGEELLLAIMSDGKEGSPHPLCALSTRRIHWPGRPRRTRLGPRRAAALAYADLPLEIKPAQGSTGISLGMDQQIILSNPAQRDALIRFLQAARQVVQGDSLTLAPADAEFHLAHLGWPRVAAAQPTYLELQSRIRQFMVQTRAWMIPYLTYTLVIACVALFLLMVANGVPPTAPTAQQLLGWGANFAPSVIADQEYWRLLSSMFVHVGILHLSLNMYCLWTAGRVIERFFGHLGFAFLYFLSGLGGSIASLWYHPSTISAGASGAIFGIFGGLVGFLAIRRRDVPAEVLKPIRSGAIGFIGYNTFFSLMIPGIDMACHLGGLATGLISGCVLTAVSPRDVTRDRGPIPALARCAATALLSLLIVGLGRICLVSAHHTLMTDPIIQLLLIRSQRASEFNAFLIRAHPDLTALDSCAERLGSIVELLIKDDPKISQIQSMIGETQDQLRRLEPAIQALPTPNPELVAIREHLALYRTRLVDYLGGISRAIELEHPPAKPIDLQPLQRACSRENEQVESMMKHYIHKYKLTLRQP